MTDGLPPDSPKTPQEIEEARKTAIAKYMAQKARHDHEWALLTARVQAFLMSQSLLATGAALLASQSLEPGRTGHDTKLVFIAFFGTAIALISSIGIMINCKILRAWHYQIREFIKNNKTYLKDFYMPRRQPDIMHHISTDGINVGFCILAGIAWLIVIFIFGNQWALNFFFAIIVIWLFAGVWIYTTGIPGNNPPGNES